MAIINIRTSEKVKKQARQIIEDLGLDMSTAINMFLVQVVKHGGMPFSVTTKRKVVTPKKRTKS